MPLPPFSITPGGGVNTVWVPSIFTMHVALLSFSAFGEYFYQYQWVFSGKNGVPSRSHRSSQSPPSNPPLLLNGRTLTTTLMFPPPPGAMAASFYVNQYRHKCCAAVWHLPVRYSLPKPKQIRESVLCSLPLFIFFFFKKEKKKDCKLPPPKLGFPGRFEMVEVWLGSLLLRKAVLADSGGSSHYQKERKQLTK